MGHEKHSFNTRDRPADMDVRECRTCSDRAFDVSISSTSDEYQRCRAGKHENRKLWSKAARLKYFKYILTVSVDSEVTARLAFRHNLCFFSPHPVIVNNKDDR
jgi:hypothetical protein